MRTAARIAFLSALITVAPIVSATGAELHLDEAASVELSGGFAARLDGGSGRVLGTLIGTIEFYGVTGTIRIARWEQQNVFVAGGGATTPAENKTVDVIRLDNATLRLTLDDERVAVRIAMDPGASVLVAGATDALGSPRWLERRVEQEVGSSDPEAVDWSWERGWPFLGRYTSTSELVGFPQIASPVGSIEGSGRVQLSGGNLSFVDAEGHDRRVRLGNWSELVGDVGLEAAKVRRQSVARAIVEGDFSRATIPLAAEWGFSAPEIIWSNVGDMRWVDASGSVETAGARRNFEHATVWLRGNAQTRIARVGALPEVATSSYSASGDFEEVRVNGLAMPISAPRTVSGTAASITLATLLLCGAAWFFYTRIDRADALEHPARARIREIVETSPGIHLRELHRRAGGAWGPFVFHVRVLSRLRFVRVRREGRYMSVYPPGVEWETVQAVHGTRAKVLDLARGMSDAPNAAAIADRLGISARLARYHLAGLREQGLLPSRDEAARE